MTQFSEGQSPPVYINKPVLPVALLIAFSLVLIFEFISDLYVYLPMNYNCVPRPQFHQNKIIIYTK